MFVCERALFTHDNAFKQENNILIYFSFSGKCRVTVGVVITHIAVIANFEFYFLMHKDISLSEFMC